MPNFEIVKPAGPRFSKEITTLGGIILAFFFILLTWAALAPLESVAIAPGVVIVAASNKYIQHPIGGAIETVLVKESQEVDEGTPLIQLEDPMNTARLEALKKSKLAHLIKKARLQAVINELGSVEVPEELASSQDPEIVNLIETEQNLFHKSNEYHRSELLVLRQQLAQLNEQQNQSKALQNSLEQQKVFLIEELDAVEYLQEKQLVRKPRLLGLQREEARLNGEILKLSGEKEKIEKQKSEIAARITLAEKNRLQKSLSELEETKQKLLSLAPEILGLQQVSDRMLIRSPASGIVKGLRYRTKGEVVKAGEAIMEIVPKNEELVIEAHISPTDIDTVYPGLQAKIQFSALNPRNTPTILGKVEYVSPDIFYPQQANAPPYYLARIRDFDEEWTHLQERVVPGMPVEVMIINDTQTALSYLISPIRDSFRKAFGEQ